MNVIVNAFILAFVKGAFSQFNFVPSIEPSRQKPAKTHREQALICSTKSPNPAVVYKKGRDERFLHATRFTFDPNET